MQLQARDKRALILGAILVTLLLAYLLWPRSSAQETSVDLVPADQRPGTAAATPAPVVTPAAPPAQPVAQPVPQPAAVPAAPASPIPEGLKLTGTAGGGAIFAFSDGTQRLVRRGRDVAPGVTLQAVRLRDVILAVGPTNYRLGFGGPPIPIQPPPPPPLSTPAPGAAPAPPSVAAPAVPMVTTFNAQQAR